MQNCPNRLNPVAPSLRGGEGAPKMQNCPNVEFGQLL
jgi:hypothetical protein